MGFVSQSVVNLDILIPVAASNIGTILLYARVLYFQIDPAGAWKPSVTVRPLDIDIKCLTVILFSCESDALDHPMPI